MTNQILIFSDEYPPKGGGAGVIAKRLALELTSLGHDISLVTGDESEGSLENVNHIKVKRRSLVWPFAYRKTFKSLDLDKYDLIILNDFVSVYVAGLLFDTKILKKCVPVIHGNDFRFVFKARSKKHIIFQYTRYYKRTIQQCKQIVTVSNYAKNLMISNAPFSMDSIPISSAYAGISPEDFDLDAKIEKRELEIPAEGRVMFTACRLVEDKGIFVQLKLFSDLSKKYSNLYWVVAGWGLDKDRFVKEIVALGLEDKVILVGKIKHLEIAKYYKLADVFWMLSARAGETLGLVYLEAALFGIPSIGYEKYGVKEAIDPGESGFFFNPDTFENDVIHCLENDMKEGCYKHAEKFKTADFAKHIEGLL